MDDLLNELKENIAVGDKFIASVSTSGTYWHIDHSLRVIKGICKSLIASEPEAYKKNFSSSWAAIKASGYIPRGLGKAPKAVVSKKEIGKEFLVEQANNVHELLSLIKPLDKNAHFEHPYFGVLNLKNAEKFIHIHTNHHLKIIRDIHAKA